MIKVEVIEKFTLKDFNELKNIKRKSVEKEGTLYVGDTFECSKDMAKYLTGDNALKKAVVKVIEIVPQKIEKEAVDEKIEEKPKKKKNKRAK